MKIFYDHQIFCNQDYGGISRYFSELIKYFMKNNRDGFRLSLKYSNNIYIKELESLNIQPFARSINFKRKPSVISYLNNGNTVRNLKKQDYDIFHPTFYNPYFLNHLGSKPFVLTVHDMIIENFPDMYAGQNEISGWKKKLIQKADKIIAVSENTKRDIVRLWNINENKIKVIYHGSSLNLDTGAGAKNYELPKKYLLFVGDRDHYKNFKKFISAVSSIIKNDSELSIVCAGGKKFSFEEKKTLENVGISDRIYHYPVDDSFLARIYNKTLAFVFPSIYEGFGIPVIEAFSCGCPAIISKGSGLAEIAGNAAFYFDPMDEKSMADSIKQVIYNDRLREELRRKGFERAKKYSWERTVQDTIQLYASIL